MCVTIFLADDEPVVCHGLRLLFEAEPDFAIVGKTGDGLQVVEYVQRLQPQVLVLDLMLPGLDGFEVTRRVGLVSPGTRVVILALHADLAHVARALDAGAAAYVLKQSATGEIVQAVRLVQAGTRYLSPP